MQSQPTAQSADTEASQEAARLYRELLGQWNARDSAAYAKLFAVGGNLVGFDGSQVDGRAEIESHLRQIFGSHPTAAFVGKIREVRVLGGDVVLLRAVAGMVPPGKSDLNPSVNTVHTLVAAKQDDRWQVELFQSTPAAFHGRPEATEALTAELRQELELTRKPRSK
ncbi:MAG TPA: SgcJ/EcaC family oxidoreductase [Gemmatimonadales bacterium]